MNNDVLYPPRDGPVPITPGTIYQLKLVVTGTNPVHLEVWLDGALKIVYDDFSASRLTTGAGIVTWDSNTKWNDIEVLPAQNRPRRHRRRLPGRHSSTIHPDQQPQPGHELDGRLRELHDERHPGRAWTDMGSGNWARFLGDIGSNDYSVTGGVERPDQSLIRESWRGAPRLGTIRKDLYGLDLDQRRRSGSPVSVTTGYETWLGNIPVTITAEPFYTLKLVATGTNPVHLEVWLNGVKKIDYNDSSASRITSGRHGIFSYATAERA